MVLKKQKLILLVVILIALLLPGCSFRWRKLNLTTSELDTVEKVRDLMITAILENDVDYFQNALSQEALETPDVNEGIEYMHTLLSTSEIESIQDGPTPISKHYERGKTNKKCEATYYLLMENGTEYDLTFVYYYEYQNRDSILGVNFVQLLDQATIDADPNFDVEKFIERPGVYNPKWDE